MFAGSFVAETTPFKDGNIDETAFRSFVEWQIFNYVAAFSASAYITAPGRFSYHV